MRLTLHCDQPGCDNPASFLFEWEGARVRALCPAHNAILGFCIRGVLDRVAEIDQMNAYGPLVRAVANLSRVDPASVGPEFPIVDGDEPVEPEFLDSLGLRHLIRRILTNDRG